MSSASTSSDLRLLESSFSNSPIRPLPKNYYWVGLIIGVAFFLLYVQLREKIKNKIMFRHDIEKEHLCLLQRNYFKLKSMKLLQ